MKASEAVVLEDVSPEDHAPEEAPAAQIPPAEAAASVVPITMLPALEIPEATESHTPEPGSLPTEDVTDLPHQTEPWEEPPVAESPPAHELENPYKLAWPSLFSLKLLIIGHPSLLRSFTDPDPQPDKSLERKRAPKLKAGTARPSQPQKKPRHEESLTQARPRDMFSVLERWAASEHEDAEEKGKEKMRGWFARANQMKQQLLCLDADMVHETTELQATLRQQYGAGTRLSSLHRKDLRRDGLGDTYDAWEENRVLLKAFRRKAKWREEEVRTMKQEFVGIVRQGLTAFLVEGLSLSEDEASVGGDEDAEG